MSQGLRSQRTRQGAAPPRLNPRFARASSGLWLPTSNKNAVTGKPLAAMAGGQPAILSGSQGKAWTTSGQSLSYGATTAGWDTGYNRLPAALTLVCVFVSYDTPSSGGGYGSPLSKDQYAFNFHHPNAAYQAGVSLHIGAGAGTYPNIQFGETAAGVLRRWVATWDGVTLKAWSSGRYIGSVAAVGALNTTDTTNMALCCAAGGVSAWNGQIFFADLLPFALADTQAKRVSENPWPLQAPVERRAWMWVDPPSSDVTGTLAVTNARDTLAAAGTPTVAGTLARTNANDALSAAGTTTVTGALAKTNADDSLAASGDVGGAVTGTLNRQNANDSLAAAGTTTVTGTLATTNASDTLAAAGSTTVVGSLAKTEGADTLQATGAAGSVTGTVAVTNRNDTLEALGTSGSGTVIGKGFEMGGRVAREVSFKPLLQRILERREAEKAPEITLPTKESRKRAKLLEKVAARVALDNNKNGEQRFMVLLKQWTDLAPVIEPDALSPAVDQYTAFMARVADQVARIQQQDEEEAILVLLLTL